MVYTIFKHSPIQRYNFHKIYRHLVSFVNILLFINYRYYYYLIVSQQKALKFALPLAYCNIKLVKAAKVC